MESDIALGIVGHAAEKFTAATEALARQAIREAFLRYGPRKVVSGRCHLGGIDIWAVEEAVAAGIAVQEFPPAHYNWERGYKPRNIQIALASDIVISLVVKQFPPNFVGMRFPYCYHCKTDSHIKSGGCWTVKYARNLGKQGEVIEL